MWTVKNITVKLPEHLEGWLRIKAAEDGLTVSGLMHRMIEGTRDHEKNFRIAMASYFSGERGSVDWPDAKDPNDSKE